MIDALVVGLGNPGKEYARSRHNLGQETVDILASRCGTSLRAGRDRAMVADVRFGDQHVILAFPTTYMNESGQAVAALMRRHGVTEPGRLIVVHDELDLEPGTVRIKVGGGLAGNNGLRSITQHLKTQDYIRVRIGIGKPRSKEHGAKHVLSRVSSAEREIHDVSVQVAADAVQMIVAEGPDAAMRHFHAPPPVLE